MSSYCETSVRLYNTDRRVLGPVNTECHWPHTPPWGNWGVNSNYGSRIDGDQFAGWHYLDDHQQWNSCTTQRPIDFPMGNATWFNDPPGVLNKQKADPDIEHQYTRTGWSVEVGLPTPSPTCADLTPEVYTFSGLFMHLYELDQNDYDELTERLYYPDIHVSMTCGGDWSCSGQSAWTQNNPSNGTQYATAKIRATVDTTWVVR